MIYLNEAATVRPDRLEAYVEDFSHELVPLMSEHGAELVGLWQTWRTNELISIWELGGFSSLDALDRATRRDERLVRYERRAAPERLRSRSRILTPTTFCPDLAQIKREQLKGEVYMLAVIPLVPEKMEEYLRLFPHNGLALEERYGLQTVGYWRGGGGEPYQTEAFTFTQLCVGESWSFWERFYRERAADPDVEAWMQRSFGYRTHHQVSYLVPAYLPY